MIKKYLSGIIVLLLLIILIGLILLRSVPLDFGVSRPESRIFCAYERLFIEFEDGRLRWGTMLLDDDGRPMSCKQYIPNNGGNPSI
jgi:hypothetical protein